MAKKTAGSGLRAEASATAEVSAKIVRERKHSITEVIPPDVTRAKSGAWLDILSPITEWAGLKGDALLYKRQQLRIQQEAALDQLAKIVKVRMRGEEVVAPLPPKILVPALEAASLENPDSPLIGWWANLLVSGAKGGAIRPYLVNLMTAVGEEEAKCLAEIWKGFSSNKEYLSGEFNIPLRAAFNLKRSVERELNRLRGREFKEDAFLKVCEKIFQKLIVRNEKAGILVEFVLVEKSTAENRGHRLSYRYASGFRSDLVPIQVCFALKLLEEHNERFELDFEKYGIAVPAIFERYFELRLTVPSNLGLEFLSVCQPLSAKRN